MCIDFIFLTKQFFMKAKFTLLSLVILFIAVSSNAQISKGSIVLGGNLNFNSTTWDNNNWDTKEKSTQISVSPSVMFIHKDNRGFGFNLDYSHLGVSSGESNTYGAGIFLRQYKPLGKGFYFLLQEALGYDYTHAYGDSTITGSLSKNISHQVTLAANPGIAYDVLKRLQLEIILFNNFFSANYTHSQLEINGDESITKSNSFSIGVDDVSQLTSLNVGVKFFFGR
jgi:hypothetical protein